MHDRAFTSCDGEQQQIRIFMEPSVRIAIREQNVCQGKTPASCSGKTQSSDVSRFFVSSKKGLKSSKVREVSDYFDSTLDRRLREVALFQQIIQAFF